MKLLSVMLGIVLPMLATALPHANSSLERRESIEDHILHNPPKPLRNPHLAPDGNWYGNPHCKVRTSRVYDFNEIQLFPFPIQGVTRHFFTFWVEGKSYGWPESDKNFRHYALLWHQSEAKKFCKAMDNSDNKVHAPNTFQNHEKWVLEVSEVRGDVGDQRAACLQWHWTRALAYWQCHDHLKTSFWIDSMPSDHVKDAYRWTKVGDGYKGWGEKPSGYGKCYGACEEI